MDSLASLNHYLSEKHCNSELAAAILSLTPDAQALLRGMIDELTPSANNLRQLLDLASDIAARDSRTIEELLSQSEVVRIVFGAGSRKQRFAKLKSLFESYRYPVRTRIEAELKGCCDQIRKDFGIEIELPENLEGLRLRLTSSISTPEDLAKLSTKCQQLASHPAFLRVTTLLRGETL